MPKKSNSYYQAVLDQQAEAVGPQAGFVGQAMLDSGGAARVLDRHVLTVQRMARQGLIPHTRQGFGRRAPYLFKLADLLAVRDILRGEVPAPKAAA
jgi:hypothetical protein